jgi:putative SOS response-associated peptidase YedK
MYLKYRLQVDAEAFKARFGLRSLEAKLLLNADGIPGQLMPVITQQSPQQAQLMQWGLVTSWSKTPEVAPKIATLSATSITEKASFRRSLLTRRCLIPATDYSTWQKAKKGQQPFYISLKNQPLLAFAGLYDVWRDQKGRELKTFAIITTLSAGVTGQSGTQMPVILSAAAEASWLNLEIQDVAMLRTVFAHYPDSNMIISPVHH